MRAHGWLFGFLGMMISLSCGSGSHAVSSTSPGAEQDDVGEGFAAFVIYDGAERTTVVPVDGLPITEGSGFWLTSAELPYEVVHWATPREPEVFGLKPCACGTVEGACLNEPLARTIDVGAAFSVTLSRECACWSRADMVEWPLEPEYPENEHGESLAPCNELLEDSDPDLVVNVISGRLHTILSGTAMDAPCARDSESTNLYDLGGRQTVLIDSPVELPEFPEELGCSALSFVDATSLADLEPCPSPDEDPGDEYEDIGVICEEAQNDFLLLALHNGRLCEVETGMSGVGNESTCARCVDARRDTCPSSLDPCGDPHPFSGVIAGADSYWIATNGWDALVRTGNEIVLHRRGGDSRDIPMEIDRIVGVLYVEDAQHLVSAMTHEFRPPEPEEMYCDEDGNCPDGFVCTAEDTCVRNCREDDDCEARGLCGAVCQSDGSCGPVPEGICGATEPCTSGFVCDEPNGRCVECFADEDCDEAICIEGACGEPQCAEDLDCNEGSCRRSRCSDETCPRGNARQHAGRCATRRRARALDEARAACLCALAANPTGAETGAIRYELGRIAEARGDRLDARSEYQRSLRARPGNATVQRRLDAL